MGPIKWFYMTLSKRNKTHGGAKRLHVYIIFWLLYYIFHDDLPGCTIHSECSFKIGNLRNLLHMWFCMLVATCCWRICLIFLSWCSMILFDQSSPPPHVRLWSFCKTMDGYPSNHNTWANQPKEMLPTFPNLLNWSINSIKPHLSYPT